MSLEPAGPSVAPVKGWQRALYRVCWTIAVGLSRAYLPGKVEGRENLPQAGPFILAPIHRSYLDWLVVARVTRRRMRYISKDAVWKVKAVGRFVELLGAFPVHRGTADRDAFNRCVEVLEGGEPLVLFPEGSRRTGPTVDSVLDGAAYLALRVGVPVVPVGIGGSERLMPKGAKFPKPGRITIVIGKPIDPAGWKPASEPGARADGSRAGKRVPRSAIRGMSVAVRLRVQEEFDLSQRRLGLDAATAGELEAAGIGTTTGPPAALSPQDGADATTVVAAQAEGAADPSVDATGAGAALDEGI
ncbi:MAG TPA: lysophospholipid acyltransferase family protein [Acidimicrobiales bacterium]|nr:lysophospholipid acyltransferase family protein [Acidimicrobiales bacterium]